MLIRRLIALARPPRRRDRRLRAGDEPRRQRQSGAADGPATLKTEDVTIPEGYTRSQIAERRQGRRAQRRLREGHSEGPEGVRHRQDRRPQGRLSLEGFLFPATYELEKGASVDDLVKDQLDRLRRRTSRRSISRRAKKKNLTIYDVVTIASMIEREVQVPKERPLVAAVIYNRLAQGIPLGIDATLRYDLDNFDKPLTESELQTDSALQHPPGHRPAADADRQPRPRLAEGGRRPGERRLPLLRRQAGHLRRARLHQRLRRVPRRLRQVQLRPRGQGGSPTDC